jgi:hypothetical protein
MLAPRLSGNKAIFAKPILYLGPEAFKDPRPSTTDEF